MISLDEEKVKSSIDEKIKSGIDSKIILESLQSSLIEFGKSFESGKYYVPELIFAGEIRKECLVKIKPHLRMDIKKTKGKVIMGTVIITPKNWTKNEVRYSYHKVVREDLKNHLFL